MHSQQAQSTVPGPVLAQPYLGPSPYFQRPPEARGATAALVMGIIGLAGSFLCGIPRLIGIGGILLGIAAKKDIKASRGQLQGDGKATAGIITGSAGIVIALLILASIAATTASTRHASRQAQYPEPSLRSLPTPVPLQTQEIDEVRWTLGGFMCGSASNVEAYVKNESTGWSVDLNESSMDARFCAASYGIINLDQVSRRISAPKLIDSNGRSTDLAYWRVFACHSPSAGRSLVADPDACVIGQGFGPVDDNKLGTGAGDEIARGGIGIGVWRLEDVSSQPYALIAGSPGSEAVWSAQS